MISKVDHEVTRNTRCSKKEVPLRWKALAVCTAMNRYFNLMKSNTREMLRGTETIYWKVRRTTSSQKMEVKRNEERRKKRKTNRHSKTIMISQIKATIAAFSSVGKVIARLFCGQTNHATIWPRNSRKIWKWERPKMAKVAMNQIANHLPVPAWNLQILTKLF